MEKDQLAFGEETRLEIIFAAKSYSNQVTRRPLIVTNETSPDSLHHVRINAFVYADPDSTDPIVITPYRFNISQYGEPVRDQLFFQIKNVSTEDVELTVVEYPTDLMTLTMPTAVPAGGTIDGDIKLTASAIGLEFEKSMTVEVKDPVRSRFTIPIMRRIYTASP